MKTAVIIGVAHMLLGIVQKGINAKFFNHTVELVHEFIPQILLMACLFGYMDFMIISKWLSNFQGYESQAPSIITIMTNIFLDNGRVEGRPLFAGH